MSDETVYDVAVIGAGMAGASLAWQVAPTARVILLERESQPGYHATGRSAAMFMETYGTPMTQALTRASRAFLEHPPQGFTDQALLHPRGVLYIGTHEQAGLLDETYQHLRAQADNVERLSAQDCAARVPCLRAEDLAGGIAEPDAMDLEVHALHQGFLRGARQAGAVLRCDATLTAATYEDDVWTLTLGDGTRVRARQVVNAAGAWADVVATVCGAQPVGLEPRRRTAFTFAAPADMDFNGWPAVVGVAENFYFKPDAGQLLGSPANADPVEPHDVVAEELDVAMGIHEITEATTLQIRRPAHVWAGLRTFVADGDFVIGWDDVQPGFFWLAGQGGYGIQTAPAASALAGALLRDQPVPDHLTQHGVDPAATRVARLRS